HLLAHDSDPFNRWEASQRLAVGAVLRTLEGEDPCGAAATLLEVFARCLRDESLDPSFRELVLTLPGEGVIAEHLSVVDPTRLRAARDGLRARLAGELAADWRGAFLRLRDDGPWRADRAAAARRALKNVALGYWAYAGSAEACEAAQRQFDTADNMTDRQAALQALVAGAAPSRDAVLAGFASEFGDEPLVMDKWLMIQATMHRAPGDPPVLERVRALMSHPAFSIRNPNRVRSLVGSFCSGNLAEFHAPDGSGHRFWAEQVAALDALNPQVAARIARALDRWRKFTPDRQASMRSALEALAAREDLSGDVREIVGKALAG
ncbi:MAG TPA: aminopeptidase N C-terminal domain-containing protein, partial [Quisquiliibacterium sp.]|nr:aminopeptidase N C-terminal domain-containing protein [Quisquiliibacterium sp.]